MLESQKSKVKSPAYAKALAGKQNLLPRPPIVVVMGHIDHGKTTLLDYIRKTNIVTREAGGITQSIGAYEIIHPSTSSGQVRKITFIDTPGHEAFSKMRARGAKVADLGILIVAADESVKPQTKEAIEILKSSQTPFIVAINKIDKPNADIEKTKQDLMQAGVLLEGFGGNITWQAISAKTGQGIDELLDLILLSAEMEELTYNPEEKAKGVIIEAKMESCRGVVATVIIKDGILKTNDKIITSSASGKIKILENFLGERVNQLSPSSPALILGFESLPQIGEEFIAGEMELPEIQSFDKLKIVLSDAEGQSLQKNEAPKSETGIGVVKNVENTPTINLILKADVSGSLEALSGVIKAFPNVKIIGESVGEITDGDVKLALSTKAIIIGFRVRVNKAAENLARAQSIKIIASEIIYELLKNLEGEIKKLEGAVISNRLKILAVFGKKSEKRQIIGGQVIGGFFKSNSWAEIQRQEQVIGKGKIINIQKAKQDIGQVNEGEECGLFFESSTMVNVGDQLIY